MTLNATDTMTMHTRSKRNACGMAALLGAAMLLLPATLPAAERCDTVPADFAALKNPVALDEKDVAYYAKQYAKQCARCHGIKGDGGGEEAKGQKFPPADFTDRRFMAHCTDGQLFYQIMQGGEERSAMPAFGPESDMGWPEEKVWSMVAFIRRFAQ